MSNKYQAQRVYWDSKKRCVILQPDLCLHESPRSKKLPDYIYSFDSRHEFRVWLELVRIYGEHRVNRQVPVEIIPPCLCYPKGKKWKADFSIIDRFDRYKILNLVEAKGYLTIEFSYILASLELSDPFLFERLLIVFPKKPSTDKRIFQNLSKSEFAQNLLTFNQLKVREKDA